MSIGFRSVVRAGILMGSLLFALSGMADAQGDVRIIVRGDDLGMTQSTLVAFERAFNQGVLTSGAIQACAPWFVSAAELCRKNPQWCIGVHLAIIGEWRGYRWRPVLPWDKVSSIVDEDGYFYTDPIELFSHKPRLAEIEAEYRAQIELVKKHGVKISYLDTHYLGYDQYPGLKDVFTRIAKDYDLPISGLMDEKRMPGVYMTPVGEKVSSAVKQISELQPGTYLWVCHIGTDCPEQNALIHTRPNDIFVRDGVGKHRAGELETLLSLDVKSAMLQKGVKLIDYRQLYQEKKR